MASDLERAFSLYNLRKAWNWTLTNPQPTFKNFVRQVYPAYATAEDENIKLLRKKWRNGTYEPGDSCKVYFPKASGILRPYTLLGVEDQIVYQALVNVIAESRARDTVVRENCMSCVFGYIYAGKRSRYFYRWWKDCYKAFSDALRKAFSAGYQYGASFDLTACYDTIDHSVLNHFLKVLGLDEEFRTLLIARCLRTWSRDVDLGDDHPFTRHGIPQGPLPSGQLAEVVLSRFDGVMRDDPEIHYFRYVDDIRLLAKDEHSLRHALLKLDLVSKSIGLFPQSSKISIHKIDDIEKEIKSVSGPDGSVRISSRTKQKDLRKETIKLTSGHKVDAKDETRFKYILGSLNASRPVSKRLISVVAKNPHLYEVVFRYLQRWDELPSEAAASLLDLLREEDIYPSFCAKLLLCVTGRLPRALVNPFCDQARHFIQDRCDGQMGFGELWSAAQSLLLEYRQLDYDQTVKAFKDANWWCRTAILPHVPIDLIGRPSTEALLNGLMRDSSADVSLMGAYWAAELGMAVRRPHANINPYAEALLLSAGILDRTSTRQCGVSHAIKKTLGADPLYPQSWRAVLGEHYKQARSQLIAATGLKKTDPSSWANVMLTFADLLLDSLYQHDVGIGTYSIGSPGSVLNSATSRLATGYPSLYGALKLLNDVRRHSNLSHAYLRNTRVPTRPIEYRELPALCRALKSGLEEMAAKW